MNFSLRSFFGRLPNSAELQRAPHGMAVPGAQEERDGTEFGALIINRNSLLHRIHELGIPSPGKGGRWTEYIDERQYQLNRTHKTSEEAMRALILELEEIIRIHAPTSSF